MKRLFSMFFALTFVLVLAACSSQGEESEDNSSADSEDSSSETVTYESESGPVEIPKNPKRIAALTYGPNVLSLDGDLVGVDQWSKANPLFTEDLADVTQITEEDPESVLAVEPDLIIAGTNMQNLEELEKIAPTVVFTWGELDYLEQQIEIGKILGKEDEAREWAEDFESRASQIGKEIKEKHGEDVTVTMFETNGTNFYIFGEALSLIHI